MEEAAQVDMVDLDHLILSLNQYFGFDTGDYDMNGNEAHSEEYDPEAKPKTAAERDIEKQDKTEQNKTEDDDKDKDATSASKTAQ